MSLTSDFGQNSTCCQEYAYIPPGSILNSVAPQTPSNPKLLPP